MQKGSFGACTECNKIVRKNTHDGANTLPKTTLLTTSVEHLAMVKVHVDALDWRRTIANRLSIGCYN